jgi:hypothetical protein
MPMTSPFRDSVLVRLPGIGRKAQIVEPTGTWDAAQVSSGVVFIHAPWSGPSCMALLALDRALMQEDLIGIPLYILNSDGLDGKFQVGKSIDQLGGWGETYVFRDGLVVERRSRYSLSDLAELELMLRTRLL